MSTGESVFSLLGRLDEAAHEGKPVPEYLYIAALAVGTVMERCPAGPSTGLEAANQAIYPVVGEICLRYQISSHIRHQTRELLLGLYRLAKTKSYRAKGKYTRKKEFEAWAPIQDQGLKEALKELGELWKFKSYNVDGPSFITVKESSGPEVARLLSNSPMNIEITVMKINISPGLNQLMKRAARTGLFFH